MDKWRYIEDDNCSASFGLAADEYLTKTQTHKGYSHTLRLYTYCPHCVLVGRFERVEEVVYIRSCEQLRMQINRRPTGGGTIIMGPGQLGVALVFPHNSSALGGLQARTVFERFSRGIIQGLRLFCVKAEFKPKNDLLAGGRKIAGLAANGEGQDSGLFHASILADVDIELVNKLLKIPSEKAAGKPSALEERLTSVSEELGRRIDTSVLREAIKEGFQRAFHVKLVPAPFTKEELEEIKCLEREKYMSLEWVYQPEAWEDRIEPQIVEKSSNLRLQNRHD